MAEEQEPAVESEKEAGGEQQSDGPKGERPEVPPEVKAALRKANKEAETLRLKLKEIEDRDKSEQEKLSERLTEAERRAVTAEMSAMKAEIAAAKGLTLAQAKRLVGSTKDELEADADELLKVLAPPQQQGSRTPVEALRPGASPAGNGATPLDKNAWMRARASST